MFAIPSNIRVIAVIQPPAKLYVLQTSLSDLLGGDLPEPVLEEEEEILTAEQVIQTMAELVSRAPPNSDYSTRSAVRNRVNRTTIPRSNLELQLQASMNLKLEEYDREAKIREIDLKWLGLGIHLNDLKKKHKRTNPVPLFVGGRRRRVDYEDEDEEDDDEDYPPLQRRRSQERKHSSVSSNSISSNFGRMMS